MCPAALCLLVCLFVCLCVCSSSVPPSLQGTSRAGLIFHPLSSESDTVTGDKGPVKAEILKPPRIWRQARLPPFVATITPEVPGFILMTLTLMMILRNDAKLRKAPRRSEALAPRRSGKFKFSESARCEWRLKLQCGLGQVFFAQRGRRQSVVTVAGHWHGVVSRHMLTRRRRRRSRRRA
jgi:hypothetical protein